MPPGEAMNLLRDLARRLHGLGGDIQSLGEGVPPEQAMISALLELARSFKAVEQLAKKQRNSMVAAQIRKLAEAMDPLADLKLHFGAGGIRLSGWVNVDAPPAELSLNVSRGVPLPDNSARYIYASHLLEHLYYPVEASRFVSECRRLLVGGGAIRLAVPDIGESLHAYAKGDRLYFERRQQQWPEWPAGRTMLEDILAYAGAFPDPAAFFEAHKYGYDFETLQKLLAANGFSSIRQCAYMQSEFPEMQVDDRSMVASAEHQSGHYSLFIEATVP